MICNFSIFFIYSIITFKYIYEHSYGIKQKIKLLFIHHDFVTKIIVSIKGLVKGSNCHCFGASYISKWGRFSFSCCNGAAV